MLQELTAQLAKIQKSVRNCEEEAASLGERDDIVTPPLSLQSTKLLATELKQMVDEQEHATSELERQIQSLRLKASFTRNHEVTLKVRSASRQAAQLHFFLIAARGGAEGSDAHVSRRRSVKALQLQDKRLRSLADGGCSQLSNISLDAPLGLETLLSKSALAESSGTKPVACEMWRLRMSTLRAECEWLRRSLESSKGQLSRERAEARVIADELKRLDTNPEHINTNLQESAEAAATTSDLALAWRERLANNLLQRTAKLGIRS